MTEREALLRAVCENPDDDTPRLVFADWLDENGEEERAEFIRLQIQLARGNYRPSEEARLKRRLRKLDVHKEQWKLDIPKAEHVVFSRGFIQSACLFSGDDLARAIADAPIRYLWIRAPVDLIALMGVPFLPRLECLDLNQATVRREDVEEFLSHEWPSHPGRLEIPLSSAPGDLRDRVLSKFREWVWIRPR